MFNLNNTFRERVVNKMPPSLDAAIQFALWLEDRRCGLASPLAEQQCNSNADIDTGMADVPQDMALHSCLCTSLRLCLT